MKNRQYWPDFALVIGIIVVYCYLARGLEKVSVSTPFYMLESVDCLIYSFNTLFFFLSGLFFCNFFSTKDFHKAHVIVLAMGMLKQECTAELFKWKASKRDITIFGGTALGFQADSAKPVSKDIRYPNIKWPYRSNSEPKKLLVHYIIGLTVFFYNLSIVSRKKAY